jgi:hypothetical protein
LTAVSIYSCQQPMEKAPLEEEYDLNLFFENEIAKLKEVNPTVKKTVSNGKSNETKEVNITDWQKELAHFTGINLNKMSANGLNKTINGDTVIYSSSLQDSKEKLIVKLIANQEHPSEILIYKEINNLLFNNQEHLHYKADALYEIIKKQKVKGMGENLYHIKGEILP